MNHEAVYKCLCAVMGVCITGQYCLRGDTATLLLLSSPSPAMYSISAPNFHYFLLGEDGWDPDIKKHHMMEIITSVALTVTVITVSTALVWLKKPMSNNSDGKFKNPLKNINVVHCAVILVNSLVFLLSPYLPTPPGLLYPKFTLGLDTAAMLAAFLLTNKEAKVFGKRKFWAWLQTYQITMTDDKPSTMKRSANRVSPLVGEAGEASLSTNAEVHHQGSIKCVPLYRWYQTIIFHLTN